jgi:hypothetical protein
MKKYIYVNCFIDVFVWPPIAKLKENLKIKISMSLDLLSSHVQSNLQTTKMKKSNFE